MTRPNFNLIFDTKLAQNWHGVFNPVKMYAIVFNTSFT